MRGGRAAFVGASLGIWLCAAPTGCAPRPAPSEAPAISGASGPPPPTAGLPIPSFAGLVWAPPSLTAGDLEELAAALRGDPGVEVVLGPSLSGREQAIAAALARLGAIPRSLRQGGLEEVIGATGAPLRALPPSSTGRPRFDASALQSMRPTGAARLYVEDAALDPGGWRSLPAYTVGSCEEALVALAAGQERSLAMLAPFLDHADAALSAAFQGQLAARLPGLTAGLAGFSRPLPRTEFTDDAGFLRHQCGHRYWRLARQFEECLTGERCARTPQIFLIDGARVGAVEGDLFIDQDCPGRVGFDAVAAFREIGREAAHVALEGLSAEWSVLADRLGLITEVAAALEDLCAPRRRRFSDEAIAGLQARFAGLGAALGSADLGLREGAWVIEDGLFHVPGLGPARQLARFAAGKGSPNSELRVGARRLRAEGLRAARCVGEAEGLPLALALYDAAGAPRFLGFLFAEELVCGELGPR